MRIRTAHFPTVKTLEDFNLDHLPSLRRDVLAHLATSTYVPKAENVILLGPPGLGKTHLAIGLGVKATQAGVARRAAARDDARVPWARRAWQDRRSRGALWKTASVARTCLSMATRPHPALPILSRSPVSDAPSRNPC
jgi:hypothetical protein